MANYYTTGFLQYVTPPVVKLSPGDNITLQFNVSGHYYASYIRTYHWFHNGCCIDCYPNERYVLDLNNTQLTIVNAAESDVGQYEVRVTELQYNGVHDQRCDALAFKILQRHAVFAPAIYHLTLEGMLCLNSNGSLLTNISLHCL